MSPERSQLTCYPDLRKSTTVDINVENSLPSTDHHSISIVDRSKIHNLHAQPDSQSSRSSNLDSTENSSILPSSTRSTFDEQDEMKNYSTIPKITAKSQPEDTQTSDARTRDKSENHETLIQLLKAKKMALTIGAQGDPVESVNNTNLNDADENHESSCQSHRVQDNEDKYVEINLNSPTFDELNCDFLDDRKFADKNLSTLKSNGDTNLLDKTLNTLKRKKKLRWSSSYDVNDYDNCNTKNSSSNQYPNLNGLNENDSVYMIGHRKRRISTIYDTTNERRSVDSLKTIIFGQPSHRRFSQDLSIINIKKQSNETTRVIFFQVFIPFLIAGFGNVGAGLILDAVQEWKVFIEVEGLYILIASFIGFKGNLEMTLAARLSTQANLGQMDDRDQLWRIGIANISLIQCQAIIVAFLAAIIAIGSSSAWNLEFDYHESIVILSTSLITASLCGFFLACFMVLIISFARRSDVNPDNVSTLFAAFFGDLTAVLALSFTSRLFFGIRSTIFLPFLCAVILFGICPVAACIAYRSKYTKSVVAKGWIAIITAMIISSVGGLLFSMAVEKFSTIALYQPIINGVGSNLVAVQASRISTYFHQRCVIGQFPTLDDGSGKPEICVTPYRAFIGDNPNVRTARLLLIMVIPGHIVYLITLKVIKSKIFYFTGGFLSLYLSVALIQVFVLLYLAHISVPLFWRFKLDPDNNAIPCLMALGDLLGTILFTFSYLFLSFFHDPNISLRD